MFSSQFLLIALGLFALGLICSIMPVTPSSISSALFLATAIIGAFIPPLITIIIFAGLVGLIILDAILGHKNVEVKRKIPKQIYRGISSEYKISTKNVSKNIFTNSKILIRHPMCSEIKLTKQQAINSFKSSMIGLRRGKYEVPPYALRIYGPFGLTLWHRTSKETSDINILPDLPTAHRIALSIAQGRFGAEGLKRRGPLGLGTNFESVREYFPDDDMRHVNWAATSRVGHPMTNQYRVEQDRDVICLLDTGRLMMAPLLQNTDVVATRLDVAIDSLCAIASVSEVIGDRIGVISFDSQIRKHLKPRRSGADAVIKSIYDVEPIPVDSDFEAAFARIGKSKRSFVIIYTDFLDITSARPLLNSLSAIVKKHKVVVASIVDEDISNITNAMPTANDAEDFYLKLNAQRMQEDSDQVANLIEKAGAEVVFVDRDNFSVECVRKYLDAKQRGKI